MVVWSFENDDGGYDPDGIVAEGIAGTLRAIADSLRTIARELLNDEAPSSPPIAGFGGLIIFAGARMVRDDGRVVKQPKT